MSNDERPSDYDYEHHLQRLDETTAALRKRQTLPPAILGDIDPHATPAQQLRMLAPHIAKLLDYATELVPDIGEEGSDIAETLHNLGAKCLEHGQVFLDTAGEHGYTE